VAKSVRKAARKSARKAARAAKRAPKPVGRKGPTPKPTVIDVHSHTVVPELVEFAKPASLFARLVGSGPPGIYDFAIKCMTDTEQRLKDMDAMGIDIQVLSPSVLQQCVYFAEPEEALHMERLGNDRVAETVVRHPDRLVGLGSVPLQDANLAAQELERCVRTLGLKGVIIATNVNGHELGEEQFRPFWAKAEQLGATVFIHSAGSPDPRMRRHRLLITLGQPLEESYAMLSLIYEGIMDAHPKLKILFAHGGGFVPYYSGRFDQNFRTGFTPTLKGDISSYLPMFHYDTVIFNPDMLDYLASKVPPSRLMLASDYPFAEKRPVEFVRRAKKISRKDQDAILGANAARLMGIAI
jgi:aminocarboxymuconate-semialdehyde decarboxylase